LIDKEGNMNAKQTRGFYIERNYSEEVRAIEDLIGRLADSRRAYVDKLSVMVAIYLVERGFVVRERDGGYIISW
jgi:hypothetical protein